MASSHNVYGYHTVNMQLFFIVSLCFIVLSELSSANPVPEASPGHKHVKINVPYKIHKIHHHHVQKVPVYKKETVIKEVPVVKHVEIVKHVPVEKLVPYPVEKIVEVEKKVFVPIHIKEDHHHQGSLPEWGSEFGASF